MKAQVTLTVTESKKLISKAVAEMAVVKKAMKDHTIAIQPSTTTFFLIQYLTGRTPTYFVCGVTIPEGTTRTYERYGSEPGALELRNHWVIRKGKLDYLHPTIEGGQTIDDILRQLAADDVYIRSANAIDPQGNVATLVADVMGGTMGRCISLLAKGVTMIFPVGLEKLIPVSVFVAAKECGIFAWDYSMGLPCGLIPCGTGISITEMQAINILTGAIAIPVASGGIAGAEGAVTLALKGTDEQVEEAVKIIEEEIKGAKLPEIVNGFAKVIGKRPRRK
jgi:hypothetical protein